MIGLLQRGQFARVVVDDVCVGEIGNGLLVLVCAQPTDTEASAHELIDKLLKYRVFSDENGKMNRSVTDVSGGMLLVPQFTLAADTNSGTRPSFTPAAPPALAKALFSSAVEYAKSATKATNVGISTGVFGADMKVHLLNNGPVTFWMETR